MQLCDGATDLAGLLSRKEAVSKGSQPMLPCWNVLVISWDTGSRASIGFVNRLGCQSSCGSAFALFLGLPHAQWTCNDTRKSGTAGMTCTYRHVVNLNQSCIGFETVTLASQSQPDRLCCSVHDAAGCSLVTNFAITDDIRPMSIR